jgi:glyoxylase-like metal-dependent hydrolase (beta-lactamase superfamily II)
MKIFRQFMDAACRPTMALAALAVIGGSTPAASRVASADVELWRLDCGTVFIPDLGFLNDSFALSGKSGQVAVSCYLIRDGDRFMLWDSGLPLSRLGKGATSVGGGRAILSRSIHDQLRAGGVQPRQVGIVALSHSHSDHSGQAATFPHAVLTIGAPDFAVVKSDAKAFNLDRSEFEPWTSGGGSVDPVVGDRDIFGDGKVIMLATPGHTPGHHSLLVRLDSGPVLLSGDLWHLRSQVAIDGVPTVNVSRADSLASMDRVRRIARQLGAQIIIGHDTSDIEMLPQLPATLLPAAQSK